MADKIILSSAYLPPVPYFSAIKKGKEILIEREENYIKQTYRNRCCILSAGGPQVISVPVYSGSRHKTPVKEITIDYSKRWQQVHLGAVRAAYSSTPFFPFYYDTIEKIISHNHKYLLDLNMELTRALLYMLKIKQKIAYTTNFSPVSKDENDLRYTITPKVRYDVNRKPYNQVFSAGKGFVPDMSIIDLIFNMGPEAGEYL